jgi:arylsulfatase A-like enzyme
MGFSDLGCYGSEIPTPHLDALAGHGLRFTQFYNMARCSPSRAALLTGLYPHNAGMGHLDGLVRPESKGYTGRLSDECVTVAELLSDAGYATSMTGKWHLGHNRGTPPWKRGFQRVLNSPFGELYFPGQQTQKGEPLELFYNGVKTASDAPEIGQQWYSPDLWTSFALKFIDQALQEKKPFFHYLAHNGPHFPLMAPPEDIARFRGKFRAGWDKLRNERHAKQLKMGLLDAKWPLTERPPDVPAWDSLDEKARDRFDHIMAIYAAILSRIDQSVGDLVQGLRQRGVLDNTLILFMSDNGGNAESGPNGRTVGTPWGGPTSNVFLGMNWATLNNTPFRRYKHFTHEGGIATPLIAHWPRGISSARRGQFVHDPAHLVDIMPTVLALAGTTYPKERNGHKILPLAGVSLAPAFTNQKWKRTEPLFIFHEGNRCVRSGKWKLVMKYQGPWELYDMDADRTELHNLAAANPAVVQDLSARWDAWAARTYADPWIGPPRNNWGAEIAAR